MQRVTLTLDDELMAEIDRFMTGRGYSNRSEAIRDLARTGLAHTGEVVGDARDCVAVLAYVYDHETRELAKRLTGHHHHHHDLSVATLHRHLDAETCLEVALLEGPAGDLRRFAAEVTTERGVRHGRLMVMPMESGSHGQSHHPPHPHGDDPAEP